MKSMFLDCYIKISILIAVADVILAVKSWKKNRTTGRYLAYACLGAAVVDISYLISILNEDYRCMSVMSSVYFVNIDIMLLNLLAFTVYFTRGRFTRAGRLAFGACILYTAFEVVVFAINPFAEIAVHYERRNTFIANYSYQMKPLYWMHLLFTYILVAAVLALMLRTMRRIPQEYRAQYRYVVIGIMAIVLVNAVFLFWPSESVYSVLDYSICGYSLTAFLLYWSCFNYSTHGMLNCLKTSIFESIGQGIVLFDYHDRLILHNERADEMLGGIRLEQCEAMEDFLRCCDLPPNVSAEDNCSLQCYISSGEQMRPLRCDIRSLKNDSGQRLGQLFVFTNAVLETDLLTGFQNWESFQMFARDSQSAFPCPTAVAVCDINSLSVINSTMGNHAGDQEIKQLADAMRSSFPKQTYYVRGVEAQLIALCGHGSESDMQACMSQVKERFAGKIQYAVSVTTREEPDILLTIQAAERAMRMKKLLDRESIHSEMLTSLIRALQECDDDTESHVRRTQIMGARLGKRIELTDVQQSNLSLLCLLHDIGKIGIPLEILNKPGRLTEEERKILQSHTEKGYDIARSNNEFRGIAEEILHHHERWDGAGYPDGLSRESIPILSRVIAVVDAYDAMTNNRSYRLAMPPERAIEELKRCAGSQFDPFIVSEFLRMLREDPQELRADEPASERAVGQPSVSMPIDTAGSEAGHNVHLVPYSRYTLDENMRIVSVDDEFEKLTGYSAEDIREKTILQIDLIPEEDRTEYLCQTNAALAKSAMAFQEHKIRRKDGTDIYVFCYGRLYFDSAVRAERSEILIVDIAKTYSMKMLTDSEQSKAQVRLHHWEQTYRRDSLTGLLNHAAFRSDVEQRLLEGGSRILMLMLDVDKFKEYNDTYGHHNGDKFLILVAQALQMSLRKEDRACRMGGDEFAAVLFFGQDTPDVLIHERAGQIFDKISMTLKGAIESASISMGAALAQDGANFNQLYEEADDALYRAKEKGRGRLVIH
ncbi:MAG: diguanylate cyclase domain-containing protein [Candidatus Ventricola sp.]